MDLKRAQWIDRLEASGQDYLWVMNRLEATAMFTPPSPGEWTVHQIAAHMRDTEEQVFLLRTELLTSETHPTVLNFDQEMWNREHYMASEPLRRISADFRAARRKLVRLMRGATKKAWENWAVHPEYGKISLDWLLEHDYYHTLEHVAQVGRLHEAETLKKLNVRAE